MSYDNIINPDDGQGIIDECVKMIDENQNRLHITNWRQYYTVFRWSCQKNQKPYLEQLFEVESVTDSFIESITIASDTYEIHKRASKLMNKILVTYEKQLSNELKKQKEKIKQATTDDQKIYS